MAPCIANLVASCIGKNILLGNEDMMIAVMTGDVLLEGH
jgi:hypothetical protein